MGLTSALSSGREEFAVSFVGKDELSGMIDELKGKVKGLEAQAKGLGKAGQAGGEGLKGIGDGMRDATSGFASFKGGLAGIKENILGLPGIIGGIGTAAVAMGAALYDAIKQPTLWEEFRGNMKAIEAQIDRALDKAKELAVMGAKPGAGKTGQLGRDSAEVGEGLSKIQNQIDDLQSSWEGLNKQREILIKLGAEGIKIDEKHAANLSGVLAITRNIAAAEDEMALLRSKREQSLWLQKLYTTQTLALELAHTDALNRSAVAAQVLASTLAPTQMFVGTINSLAAQYGKKPGAGGGGGRPSGLGSADTRAEHMQDAEEILANRKRDAAIAGVEDTIDAYRRQEEEIQRVADATLKLAEVNAMWSAEESAQIDEATQKWAELQALWDAEDGALATRKTLDGLSAIIDTLGQMPGMSGAASSAFGELAASFRQASEAGRSVTEAIVDGVPGALKAAGALTKSKKDDFYLDGAGEVAASIASLARLDFWGAATHGLAATQYFLAAGKGGKGGAGAGGGGAQAGVGKSGSTGNMPTKSEPKTVVYNISAGVLDGQSVQRAMRQANQSARGTGWDSRGGW